MKLKSLKIYIETHLKTGFIWLSKFLVSIFIFFNWKPDGSLRLYVDYENLNNLTTKNQYPLPLIGKALDKLGWIKQFTQLDLTCTYYKLRIRENNK